jgi:hypothetical protein
MKTRTWIIGLGGALLSAGALAQTLTASWTAPSANTDRTPITGPITYNLYSGTKGAEVKTQSALAATTTTVATTPGTQLCVRVTAIVNALESAQSAEACGTRGFSTPSAPGSLTLR